MGEEIQDEVRRKIKNALMDDAIYGGGLKSASYALFGESVPDNNEAAYRAKARQARAIDETKEYIVDDFKKSNRPQTLATVRNLFNGNEKKDAIEVAKDSLIVHNIEHPKNKIEEMRAKFLTSPSNKKTISKP